MSPDQEANEMTDMFKGLTKKKKSKKSKDTEAAVDGEDGGAADAEFDPSTIKKKKKKSSKKTTEGDFEAKLCLLYTSPSPRDRG